MVVISFIINIYSDEVNLAVSFLYPVDCIVVFLMDGSLFIQFRPTKRSGKLKRRWGIKLSTFLSNLLRTGILPLTRSTVRVDYFLLSPTTPYSFWVQGYSVIQFSCHLHKYWFLLPSGIFSLTLFMVWD